MERDRSAERKSILAYKIRRRKEEIQNIIIQRRTEIHRRIRHRRYLLHKLERMRTMPLSPNKQPPHIPEAFDWWEKVVLTEFQPQDWLDRFHVSKDVFFLVCTKLKMQLERSRSTRRTIPPEKRVAVALVRLSTNMEYCFISELFGLCIPTVISCVREVCEAIVLLLKPLYMHLPSIQELEDNAKLFHTQWDFPQCVGVIDSLHIPVKTPSRPSGDCWNRKGWQSVVLQGVTNGRGCFWDVCVGLPGSTDDVTTLQSSEIWTMAGQGGLCPRSPQKLMGQAVGYVLLGDEAYPLQSWLLKFFPTSHHVTPPQVAFNMRMARCRSIIENAFQRLKARWQCLHKTNDSHFDLVPIMALACCTLHNVCEVHNDPFKQEWLEDLGQTECPQPSDTAPHYMDDPNAEQVRSLYCSYFHMQEQRKASLPPQPLCPDVSIPIPLPQDGAAAPVQLLTML